MPDSKRLVWDQEGQKVYETGVDRGVLFPMVKGVYSAGEAWNGLMSVDEKPSGAEPTALYANNKKYLEILSKEDFAMTIGAYTYPAGFKPCLGIKEMAPGVHVTQQNRTPFGLSYRTLIGNDTEKNAYGYKIHLVYGATAKPAEKTNKTINESPEASELSWECSTTPVEVPNCDPSAHIEIDSTTVSEKTLKAIEDILYGTETVAPRLIMPNELAELLGNDAA